MKGIKDIKVIDMHVHMGPIATMSYEDGSADDIIAYMDGHGIDFSVCSTNIDLFYAQSDYSMLEKAMDKYKGRIRGYLLYDPNRGLTVEEADKRLRGNSGYIGIKLLPDYHRCYLDGGEYRPILEYADQNHLPVLSHTWGRPGFSCARRAKEVVKSYPNISLIMGHSCQGEVDEAIAIAKACDNAFLDLCDTGRLNGVIEKMVNTAGAEKILFGTDWPQHSPVYLMGAVNYARIPQRAKEMILRDNALEIFKKHQIEL